MADPADSSTPSNIDASPTKRAARHAARASLFVKAGRLEGAATELQLALSLDPTLVAALNDLALVEAAMGRLAPAIERLRGAIVNTPRVADLHYNLANLLRRAERTDDAEAAYRETLVLDSGHAGALNNLGGLLRDLERWLEAEALFLASTEARPAGIEAWINLAGARQAQGKTGDADTALGEAQALRPSTALSFRRAALLPPIPSSVDAIDQTRDRFSRALSALAADRPRIADPLRECDWTNFYLAYHGADDRPLQARVTRFFAKACPDLTVDRVGRRRVGEQGRKLRLGLVSAYFYDHTIGHLFKDAMRHIDRTRFEVCVFQIGAAKDPIAREIESSADRYAILPRDLSDARDHLAEAKLDLILYPEIGMDPATYFLSYARLAPIQMMGWGHPVTTGISNVDAFISARDFERDGAATDYEEDLVLLPQLFLCYPRPEAPDAPLDRTRFGFPEEGTVYYCPQSLFKFHPDFDACLAEILRRDPRGSLCLLRGHRDHWNTLFRDRIAATYPDIIDRIRFVPSLSRRDFIVAQAAADVVLDTPHFSGGKTSLEGLAMGAPIVTWAAPYLRGRLTTGFYRRMGIDDLVVGDLGDYAEVAVRIANDKERRSRLSASIQTEAGCLFDDVESVRGFEDALTALAEK